MDVSPAASGAAEDAGDTPFFIAAVALEQYRARLLQVLRFIEESASARLTVAPAEIETKLNALVEYVFAGEQEYTTAQVRLQEHADSHRQLEALQARTRSARARVYDRLALLSAEATQLEADIAYTRHLITSFETDPPLPPSTHDAVRELAAFVVEQGAGALPPTWRVGHALPISATRGGGGVGGAGRAGLGTTAFSPTLHQQALSDGTAMEVDGGGQVSGESTVDVGGQVSTTGESTVERGGAPASPHLPDLAPPPAAALLAQPPTVAAPSHSTSGGTTEAHGAGVPSLRATLGGPGGAAAPPPPSPAAFLAMVASLPPDARARLKALLPPGWRPGQPLPAALLSLDPRKLLAGVVGAGGGSDTR